MIHISLTSSPPPIASTPKIQAIDRDELPILGVCTSVYPVLWTSATVACKDANIVGITTSPSVLHDVEFRDRNEQVDRVVGWPRGRARCRFSVTHLSSWIACARTQRRPDALARPNDVSTRRRSRRRRRADPLSLSFFLSPFLSPFPLSFSLALVTPSVPKRRVAVASGTVSLETAPRGRFTGYARTHARRYTDTGATQNA